MLPAAVRAGAVAIGNFDGVHRGHALIVERLRASAKRVGGPAIVFTFDPHPVRILRPDQAPPPLTWTERKAELLERLGVDAVIAYPTDDELLTLSPQEFFERVVRQQLDARALVEGQNFFFGHQRAGNIGVLGQLTTEAGIDLEIVEPVVAGGQIVSSSRVRTLISQGQMDEARELLTEPYRIRGLVIHGVHRGAKLGFPTANVDAVDTLLPGPGVYSGRAFVGEQPWPAAINIGPNPTFGEHALKVEVHLIDFDGSLYGQPLEIDFLNRLREIRKFSGVDELKRQLTLDVAAAKAACREFAARAVGR
jgi:riboflavin kinase/FMN adenylyltransferase